MLVLATLIVIPVLGSFMCISDDIVNHSLGTNEHEIVTSTIGELGEHCCDKHTHHDLNLIGSSSFISALSTSGPSYRRPENDHLIHHIPLSLDKPPSSR